MDNRLLQFSGYMMKAQFRSFAISIVIVAALAGCQTAKPIAMSVVATPTAKGTQYGDVLAPQRAAGQDIPALKGQKIVTVRAYEDVRKKDAQLSTRTELEGIDCALDSEGYRASVKTPAEIRVPDYGYASRPVAVHCQAPGYRTGFASVQPFDETSHDRMAAASNNGLVTMVAVALVDAATDKKKHDYSYPPVFVTMNRIGCEKDKAGCH
ncbi:MULTISPECIES: hypothetical protein [Rhizobium]|uniref:Lipoprotein n=1 Tax=Rhizobium paranaense TaxID=1650438 RepID=A0A7W8XW34_9HYPH|nr:hypothetical protein [Rhizobium paranaense]MBB5576637.1 hypothetical protein [Rhizobium paranaense]